MWTIVQITLGALGLLLVLGGNWLSMPVLMAGGGVCFGLTAMVIGWEAIVKRQIVLGMRSRGTAETYSGLAAMLQGVQFNVVGLGLIGLTVMAYLNTGGEWVQRVVRRPGPMLVLFGALCLMQAAIALLGAQEYKEGPRWNVLMNLLVSRLLPGLILLVIGVGVTGLGVLEITAPDRFDAMGGGFLETLYGLR